MIEQPAPIIVSALFGERDFGWLNGLRQMHFPPDRNLLPAHLTLFHHLAPSIAGELRQRLSILTRNVARPAARIASVMNLGRGVALRVQSAELEEIRQSLADAFGTMLIAQDAAKWRPHVTIQNKADAATAKALFAAMSSDFKPRPLQIIGLATYYYRGGPWEPLTRHMFNRADRLRRS